MLLDTQALLWAAQSRERLSLPALQAIAEGPAFVSVASLWEIAIKRGLGKLDADDRFLDWVRASPLILLPIEVRHVWSVGEMPLHHRDPFDRLLVAQAQVEGLRLATRDRLFARYGIEVLPL